MFALILIVVAPMVILTEAHGKYNDCEYSELAKCNKEFMSEFTNPPQSNDLSDYCRAFQRYGDCLTLTQNCKGKFIDLDRFMILQHMWMDKELLVCKNHNIAGLTNVVNAHKKYRKEFEKVLKLSADKGDIFEGCAEAIHKDCSKEMAKDLRSDPRMCIGVSNFLKCYEKPGKKCKAKIYKDFADIAEKVAKELVKMFKSRKGVMPNC